MFRIFLLAACATSLLAACGADTAKGPTPEEFDARVAAVVMPEDKHEVPPAGCPTLDKMGMFKGMSRIRQSFSDDADADLAQLADASFPGAEKVAKVRLDRNQCEVYQIHAKGIPPVKASGPKETLRLVFIEDLGEGRRVVAVGQKFLCYGSANPVWQSEPCPQE